MVNSILFDIDFDPNERFVDFLHRVSTDVVNIFQHQWYPVELIFKELKMKYPDIPVSFNMLNIQERTSNPGVNAPGQEHIENVQDVKFDLEIYATEYKNGILTYWAYKRSLFTPGNIEYIVGEYVKLIDFFKENIHESYAKYKNKKKKRVLNINP